MGGGASKGKGGAKPNKWRYDLVALYAKYDMNESGGKNEALGKYTGIDVALKAWKGKENQLLKALKDKLEKLDEAKTKDEQVEDGTQVSFRYQTDAEKDKHWFPGMVNFRKQKALPKGSVPLQIMFENYNSNDFLGEWVYEWPEDVKNWQGFGGVGQHLDDDHRFIVPQKDIIFDNGAFATEYWQTLVRTMNGNPEGPFTEGQEAHAARPELLIHRRHPQIDPLIRRVTVRSRCRCLSHTKTTTACAGTRRRSRTWARRTARTRASTRFSTSSAPSGIRWGTGSGSRASRLAWRKPRATTSTAISMQASRPLVPRRARRPRPLRYSIASHRTASHRIASHPIASDRFGQTNRPLICDAMLCYAAPSGEEG